MPALIDIAASEREGKEVLKWVPQEELANALRSDQFASREGQTFQIVDSQGRPGSVSAEDLLFLSDAGGDDYRDPIAPMAQEGIEASREEQRLEKEHGGFSLRALAEAGASGLTFGATDALLRMGDTDQEAEGRRERRERAPGTLAANIAGAVVPALFSGGTGLAGTAARLTPAGKVASIAARVGKGAGAAVGKRGAGVLTRGVTTLAAEGVAEGFVFGAGAGLAEASMAEEPMSVESTMAAMGYEGLYGAALGGGIGGALGAAGVGFRKALQVAEGLDDAGRAMAPKVDKALKAEARGKMTAEAANIRQATKAVKVEAATVIDDYMVKMGHLDDAARQVQSGTKLATDLGGATPAYTKRLAELEDARELFRSKVTREVAGALEPLPAKQVARIRTDNPKLFRSMVRAAENYQTAAKNLAESVPEATFRPEMQEVLGGNINSAVNDIISQVDAIDARKGLLASNKQMGEFVEADAIPEIVKAAEDAGQTFTKKELAVTAAALGVEHAADVDALPVVGPYLDAVLKYHILRKGLRNSKTANKVLDVLSSGAKRAGKTAALKAVTGKAGAVSLLGHTGGMVSGALRVAGSTALPLVAKTIRTGAKSALGAGKKLQPAVVPTAVKILTGASFGPVETTEKLKGEKSDDLQDVFGQRASEIVTAAADERALRARIRENLSDLRTTDPGAAARVEDLAVARIQFLASKLPQDPGMAAMGGRFSRFAPSDIEVAKWARYVRAAGNPQTAIDDLARGQLTLEAAEALKVIYPDIFAELQTQIMDGMATAKTAPPFEKRLQLSILFDMPVDSVMRPEFVAAMVANFAAEEEKKQEKLSSVKAAENTTPAQRSLEMRNAN